MGLDYPFAYIRWTEQRNFEAFVDLIAQKKLNLKPLVTHTFDFDKALNAFKLIQDKEQNAVGVILKYAKSTKSSIRSIELSAHKVNSEDSIALSLIGAGGFY